MQNTISPKRALGARPKRSDRPVVSCAALALSAFLFLDPKSGPPTNVERIAAAAKCPPGSVWGSATAGCVSLNVGSGKLTNRKHESPPSAADAIAVPTRTCRTYFRPLQSIPAGMRVRTSCGIALVSGGDRCVLLSGGELAELFRKYLREADRRQVALDLTHLRAVYYDSDNHQHWLSPPHSSRARAPGADDWNTIFDHLVAPAREDPRVDADNLDADVVCGD